MPESTRADALERLRRQVRAVRWRQNLHELQRALYRLLAALAVAAAALVVLALLSTPGLFAAAGWGVGATTVLVAAWIARALGRCWLSGKGAPLWIDRHARLEGRLATALELGERGGARAPLFPLLVEGNVRRLAAWRPERLVPEGMPSGAFAGALAAVGALLLALLIAPWLQPSASTAGSGSVPGRIAIARRGRPPAAGRRFVLLARPEAEDSALSRLPRALQERIRERLWGEDRERAREALERAERGPDSGRDGVSLRADRLADASDRDPDERWAIATKPPPGANPTDGEGGAPPAGVAPGSDRAEVRGDGARDAERASPHQAASGAGTGTDPNLFGAASAERAARARFELPLAARLHTLGGGPAPPSSGEAPPPAPDARPDLAAAQRRDAPVLKMSVPPAYEAVVRSVFAHQGEEAPP